MSFVDMKRWIIKPRAVSEPMCDLPNERRKSHAHTKRYHRVMTKMDTDLLKPDYDQAEQKHSNDICQDNHSILYHERDKMRGIKCRTMHKWL